MFAQPSLVDILEEGLLKGFCYLVTCNKARPICSYLVGQMKYLPLPSRLPIGTLVAIPHCQVETVMIPYHIHFYYTTYIVNHTKATIRNNTRREICHFSFYDNLFRVCNNARGTGSAVMEVGRIFESSEWTGFLPLVLLFLFFLVSP